MRQLVRLALVLYALCAVLIGVCTLLGRVRALPDRVTILRFNECTPPCWIGITPGQTTLGEAQERILNAFKADSFLETKIEAVRRALIVRLRVVGTAEGVEVRLLTEPGLSSGNPDPGDVGRRVSWISFAPYGKSSFVTAADLVGLWGKPSSLVQRSVWISGGNTTYFTELRYGRRDAPGVSVNLTVPTRLELDIQPEEIVFFSYLDTVEGRVHTWPGFINLDRVQGNLFNWR